MSQVADLARHINRIESEEEVIEFIKFMNFTGEAFLLASALSVRVYKYEEEKTKNFFRERGKQAGENYRKSIIETIKNA